jgi:hypothetical protein
MSAGLICFIWSTLVPLPDRTMLKNTIEAIIEIAVNSKQI